jgi:hypothetical protein
MDSFIDFFSAATSHIEEETSTPVNAEGGSGNLQWCVIA